MPAVPAEDGLSQKYVVLKIEDWERYDLATDVIEDQWILDPDTYFVLRRADLFAASLLIEYGCKIVDAIEAALELANSDTRVIDQDKVRELAALADQVTNLGYVWQGTDRRLPT